jgi:hypothetical protein
MFINWLKSKYKINGGKTRNYTIYNINNNYRNFPSIKNFQWQYFKSIYFNRDIRFNRCYRSKEHSSYFFRKYQSHSKDIIKKINEGYGNLNFLGSINDFKIIYPHEADIEDIGIANLHLEKDCQEICKLKKDAIDEL